nr:hypothetical protein [Pandoravirus belohorizontensis]
MNLADADDDLYDNLYDDLYDDLYEDVLAPPPAAPSYLSMLPPELASLVATDVARGDVAALERLTRAAPEIGGVVATTPVRLAWAHAAPTVRLPEAARLAQALDARGLDDIALLARRCVLLAYIDWTAAGASATPASAMLARAWVASAQAMDEPGLLRLIVGPSEGAQFCRRAAGQLSAPVAGLGEPFEALAAQPCPGAPIHAIDPAMMDRLIEVSLAGADGIDGRVIARWMDDAIGARAREQCPGAFAVAPAAMPRFSDLFAIDYARIVSGSGADDNYYLVGRLRPRW